MLIPTAMKNITILREPNAQMQEELDSVDSYEKNKKAKKRKFKNVHEKNYQLS